VFNSRHNQNARDAQHDRSALKPVGPGQVALQKGQQRYVFHCAPGEEAKLLASLARLADDPATDLDWFDAAVLSHQLGRQMGQNMQRMLRSF
jgi:hypothetical protein